MIVLLVPSLFSPPVLAELQQADLITNEECEELTDISDVVGVQMGKSPEVMLKTAEVLRKHGLEEESKVLTGRQSTPTCICLCEHANLLFVHTWPAMLVRKYP